MREESWGRFSRSDVDFGGDELDRQRDVVPERADRSEDWRLPSLSATSARGQPIFESVRFVCVVALG